MHALITLGFLAIGALSVLVIWWELHRHRHQIVEAFMNPPTINRTAAEKRAELVEAIATGLLLAGFIVAVLVLL